MPIHELRDRPQAPFHQFHGARVPLPTVTNSRIVVTISTRPKQIGERLGLLATARVGDGGWVDLPVPITMKARDAFVAVPRK